MTELKENSSQFPREECASIQIDKSFTLADELSGATLNETISPKSRGDGYDTLPSTHNSSFDISDIEISSLCSVDKMRIDHLISELDKCRESKKETEFRLAASKSENKAIQKTFESYSSIQENEKTDLKLKLATEIGRLEELTTNTSFSLDALADQVSGWEAETTSIKDTVDELVHQKISLLKEMNRMNRKIMLLKAEESRMEDTLKMKKLRLTKHTLKSDIMTILTSCDKSCETEEAALATVNYV